MFWGSTVYKHFQLSPFAALTAAFLISSSGLIDIDQTTKNFLHSFKTTSTLQVPPLHRIRFHLSACL